MTINYLLVLAGGSLGAVCRYAISVQMKRILSVDFPLATFLINLTGSFLLGILLSCGIGAHSQLLLGTGFLGGFTTFSTFQVENVTLFEKKSFRALFLYVFLSVCLCILFAWLGLSLGNWIKI